MYGWAVWIEGEVTWYMWTVGLWMKSQNAKEKSPSSGNSHSCGRDLSGLLLTGVINARKLPVKQKNVSVSLLRLPASLSERLLICWISWRKAVTSADNHTGLSRLKAVDVLGGNENEFLAPPPPPPILQPASEVLTGGLEVLPALQKK